MQSESASHRLENGLTAPAAQSATKQTNSQKTPCISGGNVGAKYSSFVDSSNTWVPPVPTRSLAENLHAFKWKLADFVASYFCIGILVVAFWSSTWSLADHYLFPGNRKLSFWISAAFGYSTFILAGLLQNFLLDMTWRRSCFLRYGLSRAYTYVMAVAMVNKWRGLWGLLDVYVGKDWLEVTVSLVMAVLLLLLLRCHKTVVSAPASVEIDTEMGKHYVTTTWYDCKPGSFKFVLDTVFTVVVIASLVVCVWRGVWELLDLYLCPDTAYLSGVYSLVISYGLLGLLLAVQRPCQRISLALDSVHPLARLAFDDVITFLYSVSCITYWRGFWVLGDLYLLTSPARYWICQCVSFVVMATGLCARSLAGKICIKDDAMPAGETIVFDHFYVTKLMGTYRAWKQSDAAPVTMTSQVKFVKTPDQDQQKHSNDVELQVEPTDRK